MLTEATAGWSPRVSTASNRRVPRSPRACVQLFESSLAGSSAPWPCTGSLCGAGAGDLSSSPGSRPTPLTRRSSSLARDPKNHDLWAEGHDGVRLARDHWRRPRFCCCAELDPPNGEPGEHRAGAPAPTAQMPLPASGTGRSRAPWVGRRSLAPGGVRAGDVHVLSLRLIRMHPYPANARYADLDVDQPLVARGMQVSGLDHLDPNVHDASRRDFLKLGREGGLASHPP